MLKNCRHLKSVKCINCGYYGHTAKTCNYPISSYGIVCYKIVDDIIYYLMIQRKDTLCFTEFIRGKYAIQNINYIKKLLSRMTNSEQNQICNTKFDVLWSKMWMNNNIKYNKDYDNSKKKFNKLHQGFYINTIENEKKFIHLNRLVSELNTHFNECEWEFPKGRRKLNESDLNCACREFEEETGVKRKEYSLKDDIKQHEIIFQGSNKIRYRNVYFVASYKMDTNDKVLSVDTKNINQIKEVRDVKWFTYNEVIDKMKQESYEKVEAIIRINELLSKRMLK